MKVLSATILSELQQEEFRVFYLLDIELGSSWYRFTDCDIPLIVDGYKYTPHGFSVEPVRSSMDSIVDNITFEIDNLSDLLTTRFVGGTPKGGTVIYKMVFLDSDYNVVTQDSVESVELTCFWDAHPSSGGIMPALGGLGYILGQWESKPPADAIIPVIGTGTDELWEVDAITGGIKPRA